MLSPPPPHMYWRYPPTVLNNLHSTENIPHSTDAIPQTTEVISPNVLNNLKCTEQPPQYWTDFIWGDYNSSNNKSVLCCISYIGNFQMIIFWWRNLWVSWARREKVLNANIGICVLFTFVANQSGYFEATWIQSIASS